MSSNPYEYHNDQLGVQAAFLFEGRNQHEDSLCLIGDRGLRHRIKSGKICRLRAQGPNTPLLVTWLSLPPQWQRALIDRFGEPAKRTTEGRFVRHFIRDTRAYDFYLTYKFSDGSRINEDHKIEEYTLNASVLNTLDLLYRKQKSTVIGMRGTPNSMVKNGNKTTVWDICAAECDNFKDIQAHTLPSNSAALRRKLREYKNEGYQSIIHGNWCNKSARKVFSDEIELLNNLFADVHEKPTATEVSRRYDGFIDGYVDVINNATGEMYNPADYPKLSNATITNYLAKWVNKAGTHAIRSGNRQVLMSKFKLYHTLEQPKYAGSIISIDDRQPPFEYADGKRAWFYNAIDLGSEAITCWVYGTTKEGIIDDFYRQLVRN
ncbi:MAG TPA: hypothetical protein DCY97_00670 [Marinilabiliales bacterium]|nr:hypothetical protein [Marinilabiliales bacterium]